MTAGDKKGLRGRLKGLVRDSAGFTLIELMTVITIIAILAAIAIPMYQHSVTRAKEAALLEDLYQMRDALDKYYADHGEYPQALSSLVDKRYTRAIPVDPFTRSSETWLEVPSEDGGIFDVHSGSELVGRNGIPYAEW
jgi:general secretion pathway protein G